MHCKNYFFLEIFIILYETNLTCILSDMARYFDPSVYRIILVDQRGCGRSFPFADLTDNTTYDSVRDFEKLRKLLSIDKWMVFGGSWGSTLSLAYSVKMRSNIIKVVDADKCGGNGSDGVGHV